MNKKGFTLVELIAVIAIIGILAILVLPDIVEYFNETSDDAMKIQENQVLDAANLYIEDACIHPINDRYKFYCSQHIKTVGSYKVVCIGEILEEGYLENMVTFRNASKCNGFVMYDFSNNKYSDGKTYLSCGENGIDYKTEGIDDLGDMYNACENN